jgi:SNF2 family DNA or RNA helicase
MKYRWKTKPYKHQVRAVRTLLRNGFGGALLMEPRTGKTKTAIDWMSILAQQGKIDRAVVMCPARVVDVWVDEFHRHSPLNVHTHVWDAKARKSAPLPRVSSAYDLTVIIVNYNAFATPGKRLTSGRRSKANGRFKFRAEINKWLKTGKTGAACALDESHKIKSPSGKAANMVVSMGKMFPYRLLMTGTPVTKAKRIHDLYMQWKFLNPTRLDNLGLHTVEDVKNFTGVWTDRNGYKQWLRGRDENLGKLTRAIHQDSFAVRRSECFDLPPRDLQHIWVDLSPKTARLYDKIATEMVAEIEHAKRTHTVEASIKLVQGLRLRQITGGVATTDEGKLIRVGREKLIALEELLDEIIEHDEKVVIAAHFKADLNSIAKLTRKLKMPTFELRGGIKREEATMNIKRFKNLDGAGAFVMQPQAGALGIDLSTSSRIIWYSVTPSWVDWTQCNDRIALSKVSTTETYIMARGTIDKIQYDALQDDTDVAKMITDRPERILRRTRKLP